MKQNYWVLHFFCANGIPPNQLMKHNPYIIYIHTVDGRNPAPVDRWQTSHYLQGFNPSRWCRISLAHPQYVRCISMYIPLYPHDIPSMLRFSMVFYPSLVIINLHISLRHPTSKDPLQPMPRCCFSLSVHVPGVHVVAAMSSYDQGDVPLCGLSLNG